MNRIEEAFERRSADGQTALVIYLTFADPSPEASVDIIVAAAEAGADVVELGVPFSDPNADGVAIQEAMQRALAAGGTLRGALACVRQLREQACNVPVVLFGYYNPISVMGVSAFAAEAAACGVDAVLTVDLPMDELAELHTPLTEQGVGVVPLVAPTSGQDRIAALRKFAPPFVYYVSMTGVTGGQLDEVVDGSDRVALVREATGAKVAVGFGIRTGDDARRVAAYADGVVVGSAVVRAIADGDAGGAAQRVGAYVGELRAALDGLRRVLSQVRGGAVLKQQRLRR